MPVASLPVVTAIANEASRSALLYYVQQALHAKARLPGLAVISTTCEPYAPGRAREGRFLYGRSWSSKLHELPSKHRAFVELAVERRTSLEGCLIAQREREKGDGKLTLDEATKPIPVVLGTGSSAVVLALGQTQEILLNPANDFTRYGGWCADASIRLSPAGPPGTHIRYRRYLIAIRTVARYLFSVRVLCFRHHGCYYSYRHHHNLSGLAPALVGLDAVSPLLSLSLSLSLVSLRLCILRIRSPKCYSSRPLAYPATRPLWRASYSASRAAIRPWSSTLALRVQGRLALPTGSVPCTDRSSVPQPTKKFSVACDPHFKPPAAGWGLLRRFSLSSAAPPGLVILLRLPGSRAITRLL